MARASPAAALLLAVSAVLAFHSAGAAALDADALSQRYRNWHYFPDWVIPPLCMNPFTCKSNATSRVTDVFQIVQLPEEPGLWRAFYLQFDGIGYETYSASSLDMVHFDLADPTLIPGQPGCIASPRAGRPPLADAKPVKGDADWGGITFIGPLLQNYTVGAPAVLRRTSNGKLWYAAGGYPGTGYEAGAGADFIFESADGLNWKHAVPHTPFLDPVPAHGAAPWESNVIYAPFLFPALDGSLGDFYNAQRQGGLEESGAAYLPGGAEALPGWDAATNTSLWRRDAANPLLPNDVNASFQASDPKVFYDAEQGVWINLYFCNGDYKEPPYAGGANICIAFSLDQRQWVKSSTPLYAHGGHPKGYDAEHAHKVWLTTNPATGVQCEWRGGGGGALGRRRPIAARLAHATPIPPPHTHPLQISTTLACLAGGGASCS